MTASANPRIHHPATTVILLLNLCIGLFLGCSLYEPSYHSLIRSAIVSPVLIVGVFVCVYLPLICTYFSFITDKPIIILFICFFKAIAFGFTNTLILRYFSSAGWLIRFFFLFSDSFTFIILLILWFQHFVDKPKQIMSRFYIAVVLSSAITAVDIFVVFPFVKRLF